MYKLESRLLILLMLHINSCSLPAQSSLPYVEAIGKNGGVLSVISVICGRTSVLVHETKKLSNIRLCIIITLWIIHITRMASGCFYNANLASSVDSYLTPTIDQRLNLRCFFGNIMSEDLASYRWMFSLPIIKFATIQHSTQAAQFRTIQRFMCWLSKHYIQTFKETGKQQRVILCTEYTVLTFALLQSFRRPELCYSFKFNKSLYLILWFGL